MNKLSYYQRNKEKQQLYYLLNKEKILKYAKERKKNLTEEQKQKNRIKRRIYDKNRKNKEHYKNYKREWVNKQYKTNTSFKIKSCCIARICQALKKNKRLFGYNELIGCSWEEFKIYIESKFRPGMTWDNYGKEGWHMDHIIPCCCFDLSCPEHQLRCFHYTNIQPLWWPENLGKSGDCKLAYFVEISNLPPILNQQTSKGDNLQ